MIVKGAGVIEQLGRARTVLFDKTGTLTLGSPEVERVVSLNGVAPTEALRLAASLDQFSAHVLAEALVHDAEGRGLRLTSPIGRARAPGSGISGAVEGRAVVVGAAGWLEELALPAPESQRAQPTVGRKADAQRCLSASTANSRR